MKGSSVLPWLFFGPLLLMLGAHVLWQVTGWPWAARVAVGALIWVGTFALVAFASHWWHYRGR